MEKYLILILLSCVSLDASIRLGGNWWHSCRDWSRFTTDQGEFLRAKCLISAWREYRESTLKLSTCPIHNSKDWQGQKEYLIHNNNSNLECR